MIESMVRVMAAAVVLTLVGVTVARAQTTGGYAVLIEGQAAGYFVDFQPAVAEATDAEAAVVDAGVTEDVAPAMHFKLGADMGPVWADWLGSTSAHGFVLRDLDLVDAADPTHQLTMSNSLITAITVPKLDGSSKDAASFDVEFEAEEVRWSEGGGTVSPAPGPGKQLQRANFSLELGGSLGPQITAIEGFTWKQAAPRDELGQFVAPAQPDAATAPTAITLTVDAAAVPAWSAWREQFAAAPVKDAAEKAGTLRIFAADGVTHAAFALAGVGIVAIEPAVPEKPARFNVELYVEKMQFKLNYTDAAK